MFSNHQSVTKTIMNINESEEKTMAIPVKIIAAIAGGIATTILGEEGIRRYYVNNKIYDKEGFNKKGYNKAGYDREGYDRSGYNAEGYNKCGFDRWGYNKEGWNKEGYSREGYNKEGYDRKGYNIAGYDREGYDRDGYSSEGFDKYGHDRAGYSSADRVKLLSKLNSYMAKAKENLEKAEWRYFCVECRNTLEKIFDYYVKYYNLSSGLDDENSLCSRINKCGNKGIISLQDADKLHGVRKYCNEVIHGGIIDTNSSFYTFAVVEEQVDNLRKILI